MREEKGGSVAPQQNAPSRLDASRTGYADRDRFRSLRIVGLLLLCGIGAELLAAYNDTTGDPAAIAFVLVFFAALYGAPALLARDLARRMRWGWPSMLLLFAALGITEACLIDQALFSASYQGYEGWEETREATLIPALGVSAYNVHNFIGGHVIFSFGAPVAIAEAWAPSRAGEPWLGRVGTVIAVLAYAGAAFLILLDPESHSASSAQLAVSAMFVAAFVAGAVLVGRRSAAHARTPGNTANTAADGSAVESRQHSISPWIVFVVTLVPALISGVMEETWTGFAVATAAVATAGVGVWWASGRWSWSVRHAAAVALAFLVVRGAVAFTYFPLLGDVASGPKYAHNVVMLFLVGVAGWLALRRR